MDRNAPRYNGIGDAAANLPQRAAGRGGCTDA
jgi:hypothetical protein